MLLNYFSVLSPVSFISCCRFFLVLLSIILLSACGNDTGQNDAPGARTTPQNVTLTTGTRINDINWSGVSGARGYTVYWSTEPNVTPTTGTAIDTQQPHLAHRGLANGTTYYYVITSDTDFGQSAPSAVVEGTPQAARPAQPTDLTLKAGNGRITLRWDPVPGATHYTLYWKDSTGVSTDIDTPDTRITHVVSPFVHPGLENGRDYFYRLVAENAHGASDASEERNATPLLPLPSAPQITQADTASGQVTLHWQHTGIASRYELYWSTNPLSDIATENPAPLTQVTSPYTHTPLQDGQTYYYRVRTRSGDRVSALSNPVQVTPPGEATVTAPGTVPTAPTDITVSLGNGQLSLNWPPVDGAQDYHLYWTTADTGEVTTTDTRITQIQPPYTHIHLNNGTRYRYRLSALNQHGESALSNEVNGTPQIIIPGIPAGIQALAGDKTILVRWNPVQNATSYTLTLTTDDATLINTVTDVSSPYSITDLNNATAYQIQLQAQNTQGLSDPSEPVTATPQEPVPNTPNNLVARSSDAEVLLQWAAARPQDANDPNEVITAYRVYTATRPGVHPDNSILIDATPTSDDNDRWQLRHTGLQNGQRYYYVVSAQNAGGESGISQEVWARPRVSAPGIITSLSAEAGDGQVLIDFTPPDNSEPSTTYNLYWTQVLSDDGRGERSPTEVISNVQWQPGYLFDGSMVTNGTTYFFRLSAVNDGNESPLSDEVSATPQIPAPGQAPQDTQTLTDSGQVTLNWTPVAQASSYVIYWATEPDISPQTSNRLSGEAIQPGFVHDGLDNGQSYFYRIAAINAGGESALSALFAAQPQVPPPAIPSGFDVQPGDGQVTLNFALAPTATDYRVFWHPDVEAPLAQWSSRTVQPGDILPDLDNDQTYFYRLQSNNAGGSSSLTESISATAQPNPPATPTGLAIVTGDTELNGELNITWNTQPGLRYTLYWSGDPQIAPRDSGNVLSDARPTYRHTGLNSETTYYYQVSASNSGGESPASEPVQATSGNGTPTIPGTPQNVQGSTGDGQNTLQWQAVTSAEQYTVQWSAQSDMSEPQSTPVSTPSFVHEEPPANVLYYRVIAQNSAGDSLPSVIVQIAQDSPSNQAPQITQGDTTTATLDEDSSPTAFALTLNATDNDGDALTWAIVTPANRGTAQINSNNATASVSYIPQANINGNDTFIVQVNDGQGGTDSIQINVSITPQNDAPTITNTTLSLSIEENTTAVTAITVTDIDSTAFTYLLSGADSGLFSMMGNTLVFNTAPDFDNPQDNGKDNTYNVTIIASDGSSNNNESTARAFAITITNANDSAPVITNTNLSPSVVENATAVTAITVTDTDSTAFTYTLGGADSALFAMTGNNLRFITAPDFETPQDNGGNNTYNVSVTANDGTNSSAARAFAIMVTDANDSAPVITNSNLTLNIAENTTAVAAITVTDTDSTTFTYTLSGADNALFNVEENTLVFIAAPDFENPQDSNNNNVYNISVTANDGSNSSDARAFAITVTDVDDSAPVITLNGSSLVTLVQGATYVDAGASATDDRDGTVGVITSGTVDIGTIGTYTITYTATDAAGNTSTATRTVNVIVASPFVTTWQTDNPGVTADDQIQIKTSGGGYNYTVDWGDGQTDSNVDGDITHTYSVAGTYTVSITGAFPRIISGADTDAEKLLSIEQWGNIQWQSMDSAFLGCRNLVGNASDVPDLSQVTDMSLMFGRSTFNQDISTWDVKTVTDMSRMFMGASAFNQDISTWDVSAVTDMSGMFAGRIAFNQNLNAWDVSSVTDMFFMFQYALAFNQDLSGWNVSSVTNMNFMFQYALAFNQDLSGWNVSSVTNMNVMFHNALAFNQDLSGWDVSSVRSMGGMFVGAPLSIANYDALLLGWSVQSVQNDVPFSAGNSQYSLSSQAARDTLTDTFGWTVTDGGSIPSNAIPTQPQNVQGSTGDGQNTLQWQAVTDAEQYTVLWSTQSDMSEPQSTTVSTPSFVHEEPPASILYYQVIAQNSNGNSPPSAIAEITQDIPNQAPQITQGDTTTVTLDEDSSPIAFALTLNAIDNDGDALTWTIATPANRGTAQINSNNTSVNVSYTPQANVNGSDVFTVRVDDGQDGTDTIRVDVSITPQNDAPTITHADTISVEENTPLVVATISAEDIDIDALSYRLSGGEDQDLFSLGTDDGQLRFNNAADYEIPGDIDEDNDYKIQIIVNDGNVDSAPLDLTLTITDINDVIPLITNVANLSVSEQTTVVTTITVADADSDTFSTRIAGGDDNAFFSLTGNDLTFTNLAPIIINPGDADGDNEYLVSVIANDGANDSEPMDFAITVTGTEPQRWRGETLVNPDDAGSAFKPQVVLDSDGNGLAIWSRLDNTEGEYIVWVNRYVVGTGWGTAKPIGTNNSAVDGNAPPRLAMDANGNALAIWTRSNGTGNNVWGSRYVAGTGWGVVEPVGADIARPTLSHQIAMNANGNAQVVWFQITDTLNRSIWTNRYVADTGWGRAEPVETQNNEEGEMTAPRSPQIAVDADGNGIAVWYQANSNPDTSSIWASRYVVGTGWTMAEPIETGAMEYNVFPKIAMDANGNGIAVWFQSDGTNGSIRVSRYVAGTGWGATRPIETGAIKSSTFPEITMGATGNALVVWSQSDGARSNIWSNRYVPDSGWGTAEPIGTNDGVNPLSLQIVMDAKGNARMVWAERGGTPLRDSIWSNLYVVGGGWRDAERISSIGTEEADVNRAPQPQIAVGADGNALAVWSRYDGTRETIWSNSFE